ncbi:hypothetical protein SAMN04489727_3143 [Amycolatopsis tolypomycina]|uniref:Uncharacterized protein n=1 Tax=Amycolatopsis tolypomycina TaxID=208445 RepID=A0A1H4R3J6_9PSEU|nr:hypothetical protein [Amycolatopsis tolypomycina]SEC26433.1 hypothetical protein SAMN04489727_3143 [Amycolatopsis tolypomycina]
MVKNADPLDDLLPAEIHLTGRTAAEVEADPRRGQLVQEFHDGELVLLSLSDELSVLARRGERLYCWISL